MPRDSLGSRTFLFAGEGYRAAPHSLPRGVMQLVSSLKSGPRYPPAQQRSLPSSCRLQFGVGGDQAFRFTLPVVFLRHGPPAIPAHRGSFRRMAKQPHQGFGNGGRV